MIVKQSGMCKDCWAEVKDVSQRVVDTRAKRKTVGPGPRCGTHWRIERERVKAASHDRRVQAVYGLGPGEYERIYEFQGGRCAICRRARGISRKLAVDHDHRTRLVRGLLCKVCNSTLGHARDELEFFRRAYWYLSQPPAQQLGIQALFAEKEEPDGG